jgi:hypothetical protein
VRSWAGLAIEEERTMRNLVFSLSLAALAAVLLTGAANAENLDVSVITIKKFMVLENGGVKIPSGKDSYWDFLEITNNDNSPLPVVITGVNAVIGIEKGCILTEDTKFPLKLPYKSTLEFTIRQGCGISGVAIDLDGGGGQIHQQRYGLSGPLMRLASPVFQARMQRSN